MSHHPPCKWESCDSFPSECSTKKHLSTCSTVANHLQTPQRLFASMLVRLALVLTLTIAVIQVTAIQQPRSIPNKYTDWRLPRWVLPRHYKLRLLPFIEEGHFTGQVDILLECMEPTQLIVLHMADIRIDQDDGLQVIIKTRISLYTIRNFGYLVVCTKFGQ